MKKNKKSQAVMEFIIIYGWWILIIIALIGALWFFGLISPSNFLPKDKINQNCCDTFCQLVDGSGCYAFNDKEDYVRCGNDYVGEETPDYYKDTTTIYWINNVSGVCGTED